MSKINAWLADLEEIVVEAYMKGLRGDELREYIKQSAVMYDEGYVRRREEEGIEY